MKQSTANTYRRGPAPDQRYERINPGGKVRRRALSVLPVAKLREYSEELLYDDFRAGWFPNFRAIPSMAQVMALALSNGAYRMGIEAMADLTGISTRTVIRGSKATRERPKGAPGAGGYLWHTRGTKDTGVTIWRPAHVLVDAITAVRARRAAAHQQIVDRKAQRAELQRIALERNAMRRNTFDTQCDTVAHVAAPWAAGEGGGGEVSGTAAVLAVERTTTEPDKPDQTPSQRAMAAVGWSPRQTGRRRGRFLIGGR